VPKRLLCLLNFWIEKKRWDKANDQGKDDSSDDKPEEKTSDNPPSKEWIFQSTVSPGHMPPPETVEEKVVSPVSTPTAAKPKPSTRDPKASHKQSSNDGERRKRSERSERSGDKKSSRKDKPSGGSGSSGSNPGSSSSRKPKVDPTKPSALTSIIHPSIEKVQKATKDEKSSNSLLELKAAFDMAESISPGISHAFIAQIIETLKRSS